MDPTVAADGTCPTCAPIPGSGAGLPASLGVLVPPLPAGDVEQHFARCPTCGWVFALRRVADRDSPGGVDDGFSRLTLARALEWGPFRDAVAAARPAWEERFRAALAGPTGPAARRAAAELCALAAAEGRWDEVAARLADPAHGPAAAVGLRGWVPRPVPDLLLGPLAVLAAGPPSDGRAVARWWAEAAQFQRAGLADLRSGEPARVERWLPRLGALLGVVDDEARSALAAWAEGLEEPPRVVAWLRAVLGFEERDGPLVPGPGWRIRAVADRDAEVRGALLHLLLVRTNHRRDVSEWVPWLLSLLRGPERAHARWLLIASFRDAPTHSAERLVGGLGPLLQHEDCPLEVYVPAGADLSFAVPGLQAVLAAAPRRSERRRAAELLLEVAQRAGGRQETPADKTRR